MIDILFIAHHIHHFEVDHIDEIRTFKRFDRTGILKDGKSFKLCLYDSRGDWLERLRGLEIREVKCLKDVRISPRERLALQAMMNRG
jgi:hypothetical protein